MNLLIRLCLGTVVFGIALTFITRSIEGVRVQPRSALPVVALVFAVLNALFYGFLATVVTVGSLFTLAIVAPFLANAALLWTTDKLLRPLKIDGLKPLLVSSLLITVAHFLLRLVDSFV